MARDAGKKSILDFLKPKALDDDEFDDDLFDDDDDDDDYDDDDYYEKPKKASKPSFTRASDKASSTQRSSQSQGYSSQSYQNNQGYQSKASSRSNSSKLVDFNNQRQRSESVRGRNEVYVIKPQEISESQTVTDFLKNGKTIVINMEGLELAPAQRIIDFIGGACYALNGSLQAISANIFIAAPNSIEVSGDLREEILNESTISPQLGQY